MVKLAVATAAPMNALTMNTAWYENHTQAVPI